MTATAPTLREWVVGFLIDTDRRYVVGIRKLRPPWMRGMLNGVGGKVEPGETPVDAMRREFEEEAGIDPGRWSQSVRLNAVSTEDRDGVITTERGIIHFFSCIAPAQALLDATAQTDELLERWPIRFLLDPELAERTRVVPNLRWLIPLAAHTADHYTVIDVIETATSLRR